jgi:uncharacterized heparinase superfamily protein
MKWKSIGNYNTTPVFSYLVKAYSVGCLYLRTLRHLKISQIVHRVKNFIIKPSVPALGKIDFGRPKNLECSLSFPVKNQTIMGENKFLFLNRKESLIFPQDWNSRSIPLLWSYNLHYFDGILDPGTSECTKEKLINDWILENLATEGIGWQPYPISLRICNWIKWIWLKNGSVDQLVIYSLFQQTIYLSKTLEFHLLGNHLLENAKALIFSGYFFGGMQGEKWKRTGIKILRAELTEQILDDGGHFELSPMYHAIVLDLVLDILQLSKNKAACEELVSLRLFLEEIVLKMNGWLAKMCHSDEEISYFNDAAVGIAPSPKEIQERVSELVGFRRESVPSQLTYLSDSGFVRFFSQDAILIMDVGEVGPSYLAGHGHADTLSLELSLFSQRVLVNLGTSQYGFSDRRSYERGTSAHSTMELNERNSSEVWGGFRVGRRAVVDRLSFEGEQSVTASHNGYKYLSGAPRHVRKVVFKERSILIEDSVEGPYESAKVYFHFHPSVNIVQDRDGLRGCIKMADKRVIFWNATAGDAVITPSEFAAGFGDLRQSSTLVLVPHKNKSCSLELTWN